MTKKNFKELVKSIERLAQAAPPPPTGAFLDPNAPGPFGGGTTRGHGGTGGFGGGGGGSTAVMAMQHALQDLATDVSSQINLQQMVKPDPNNPRAQEEAKSREAFGTFLAKYVRDSAVQGVEYDPNPKVRRISDKQRSAGDPRRLSVVMDTMDRVGHETSEQFADGNWGPRTNAAVRNAYALAQGLFNMVKDLNKVNPSHAIQITKYGEDSLKNLESMATADNSLTPEQKSEAAPLVTRHVQAIHAMYDEVKNKVLEHKTYRQFIESDKQYKTYDASGLTPQQIKVLTDAFPQGFPIQVGNARANVDIGSLTNVDKLNQWITAHPQLGKITPQTIADQIERQHGHVQTPGQPYQGILTQNPSTDPGY